MIGQHEQIRDERTFKAPAFKDYAWEREVQRVTQRRLLERLRYKQYLRAGTLSNFMQRLGDWGRKYFPFLGRGGWDGFGGQR